MMAQLAAWWLVVKKYWGYFQTGKRAGVLARERIRAALTPQERGMLEQQARRRNPYLPPASPAFISCDAIHRQLGAICEKPIDHLDNHCGSYMHGTVSWPHEPTDAIAKPLEVGIDWAKGCDITSYSCSSCGFETGIAEEIVKHMKGHGATRLTVIPVRRPPAYREDFRRG